jgi:hypothetical protein
MEFPIRHYAGRIQNKWKLRRAMVRLGRDRPEGEDEAYWGGEETEAIGRGAEE